MNERNTQNEQGSSDAITPRITRREVEIFHLVSQGLSSKEVADALLVTKRTVDFHMGNVYDKLNVPNRIKAIRELTLLGYLPLKEVKE